jgi:DNA polymerase III epsilon subunit-like protein
LETKHKYNADMPEQEHFISVDVETAGPHPGRYALLSIGACAVKNPVGAFYAELQPDREEWQPEALRVSGLKLEKLKESGLPPREAMQAFADWVAKNTPADHRPVFVAFNASFDWMFVNEYFHRYLDHNPFGHSALDIKAYFMGLKGMAWSETSMKAITHHYFGERSLTHHALRDALDQAELFRKMLAETQTKNK